MTVDNGYLQASVTDKQLWLDLALDIDRAERLGFGVLEQPVAGFESHSILFVFEKLFAAMVHDELCCFFIRFEGKLVGHESKSDYRFVTTQISIEG